MTLGKELERKLSQTERKVEECNILKAKSLIRSTHSI